MKLYPKHRKESKHGNRFYTDKDMAIIKHDVAVKNSEIKRGEKERKGNEIIYICGCGVEGCFIHSGYDSIPQDKVNEWEKNRSHHSGETKKERKERKEKERKHSRKRDKILKELDKPTIVIAGESNIIVKIDWDLLIVK